MEKDDKNDDANDANTKIEGEQGKTKKNKKKAPQTQGEKRGPGRPKNQKTSPHQTIHGIVGRPIIESDIVELVYCNPLIFKRLLQLLKYYQVSEIHMLFGHDGLQIQAIDHTKKSTTYITILGQFMNWYYCKAPVRICVSLQSIDRIFSIINKTHYKITFVLKENYRSTMYIILKETEYNSDDSYEIDVIFSRENLEVKLSDDDYPLKFNFKSKYFKSKILSIGNISPFFTIQKCADRPLQFKFDKSNQINWTNLYSDQTKLKMVNKLEPDDIFNVSVFVNHIKPIAKCSCGEEIQIAVDKIRPISFTMFVDKRGPESAAFIVKIFTETKKN